jgi:anti-anti-sigma regulatory factor
MLRIVPLSSGDGALLLRVEGRLQDAWVPLLHEECDRSLAAGARLALDLQHLRYVDVAGRLVLRRLRGLGVPLLNCPPLIEALLEDSAP